MSALKVERAVSGGQLIGWRLTIVGTYSLLVWANQEPSKGLTAGGAGVKFTPAPREIIIYEEVQL